MRNNGTMDQYPSSWSHPCSGECLPYGWLGWELLHPAACRRIFSQGDGQLKKKSSNHQHSIDKRYGGIDPTWKLPLYSDPWKGSSCQWLCHCNENHTSTNWKSERKLCTFLGFLLEKRRNQWHSWKLFVLYIDYKIYIYYLIDLIIEYREPHSIQSFSLLRDLMALEHGLTPSKVIF